VRVHRGPAELGRPEDTLRERERERVRERRRRGRARQVRIVRRRGGDVEDAVRLGQVAIVVCACQVFVVRLVLVLVLLPCEGEMKLAESRQYR
jgi:hypothetical protein